MTIQEEISQLEARLADTSDLASQADLVNKILGKHLTSGSKDGKPYIERLAVLAEQLDSDEYRAYAHLHSGTLYKLERNFTASLDASRQALAIFTSIDHKLGQASANNHIGLIFNQQNNYPTALGHFMKALHIHEELGNLAGSALGYSNIGIIYFRQGNYALALEYFAKALPIREKIGDKTAIGSSYTNIGTMYQYMGNYDKALEYQMKALEIVEAIGNKEIIGISLVNIGTLYSVQRNFDVALEYFFKAIKLLRETGDKRMLASSYNNMGLLYTDLEDYVQSLSYLNASLEISESENLKETKRDALNGLYQLNKAKGDTAAALEYYEKYIAAKEKISNAETAKKIADMQFSYDMEKKEKEVEIEKLINVELKAEKEKSDTLLLNILPAGVAEELKKNGNSEARMYEHVTVLFTDFQNFTGMSQRMSPKELIDELHACFSAFDLILERHGIEKIKTVGDAYLAAAGVPASMAKHAEVTVRAAIEIRDFMLQRKREMLENTFGIRIGIHSGSVIAGIVGLRKFAYDIWGDTVNTAARMEQNSETGKINISETTYQMVKEIFDCQHRGEIEAKNKGFLKMYFIS